MHFTYFHIDTLHTSTLYILYIFTLYILYSLIVHINAFTLFNFQRKLYICKNHISCFNCMFKKFNYKTCMDHVCIGIQYI